MRFNAGSAAIAGAALATTANAVNPLVIKNQEFVDSIAGSRFDLIGIDYQPGGSAGFQSGSDPLSDGDACLRDAALMQQLGINTIRVYNLDPTVNHDTCASIFNAVGIYMILDVNSPFQGGNINQDDPKGSYNTEYVNRTFGMIDAFRGYPNLIGFFGANELINNDQNAKPNAPYIRAVQRDMKQYLSARGGRPLYVGYSAAQVQDVLVDTSNYLQCAINGDENDESRADYFALNSYSWCGQSSFTTAGYDKLVNWFENSTIPVFFSEYGCNKVTPRPFTEVGAIYGNKMTSFSGGLVYQWTQDTNDYGIVKVNSDGSVKLLEDYDTLKKQFGNIDRNLISTVNQTATSVQPAKCDPSLISSDSFSTNWNLPVQPSGVSDLIQSGSGNQEGKIIQITDTQVKQPVTGSDGSPVTGLSIDQTSATNPQVPNQSSSGGSKGSNKGSSSSAAVPGLHVPEFGMALSAIVTVLAFVGLY